MAVTAFARRRSGERGFTLLELIVVLVIVAVVSALVVPAVTSGWRQGAVRRTVRAFISASRTASAQAVRTREPVALAVWPEEGRFGVAGSDGDGFELPSFAEFGEIVGGREAEGDDEILFDFFPTGAASGGIVEIRFDNRGRLQAYRLVIEPLIGRVRIEEGS